MVHVLFHYRFSLKSYKGLKFAKWGELNHFWTLWLLSFTLYYRLEMFYQALVFVSLESTMISLFKYWSRGFQTKTPLRSASLNAENLWKVKTELIAKVTLTLVKMPFNPWPQTCWCNVWIQNFNLYSPTKLDCLTLYLTRDILSKEMCMKTRSQSPTIDLEGEDVCGVSQAFFTPLLMHFLAY